MRQNIVKNWLGSGSLKLPGQAKKLYSNLNVLILQFSKFRSQKLSESLNILKVY